MAESNNVRIAFIGCGDIAQAHWRGIQSHAPQLQVVAAVDENSSRAAEMAGQTGGRAFTSLDDALAWGNFDAVDIMLPHNVHEEAAILAFAAGKHVVLEKPMATTIDACDRILAAAREAGTVFIDRRAVAVLARRGQGAATDPGRGHRRDHHGPCCVRRAAGERAGADAALAVGQSRGRRWHLHRRRPALDTPPANVVG